MDVGAVRSDLIEEQEALDQIISGISISDWDLDTASPGWSVADQIAHLAYFDNAAALAIASPDKFQESVGDLLDMYSRGEDAEDAILSPYRAMESAELLEAWREARLNLAEKSCNLSASSRVVWYGPSMGSKSFLTARLMEVWAHGQDILDAIDFEREETDRLHHIAQLGFITRSWSFMNRGQEPPSTDVNVMLESPSGDIWEFGSQEAEESVTGSALDFCLLVTQRRNLKDTSLEIFGSAALEWMKVAQAFAGPATDGPEPR
tara:strand:+ start:200 stop:988 length:789 start_codon:yes stop_codon:yes gene_type:complete